MQHIIDEMVSVGPLPIVRVGSQDVNIQSPSSPTLSERERNKPSTDEREAKRLRLDGVEKSQMKRSDVQRWQSPEVSEVETGNRDPEALDRLDPHKIVDQARDRFNELMRLGQDEAAWEVLDEGLQSLEKQFHEDQGTVVAPWIDCMADLLIDNGRKQDARDLLSKYSDQIHREDDADMKKREQFRSDPTEKDRVQLKIAQTIESEMDRFRRCEDWDKTFQSARRLREIVPEYFDSSHPIAGFNKVVRILHLGLLQEREAMHVTRTDKKARLLTKALEIFNYGCYARELFDEFFDSHGAKFMLFDRSEAANIFFSAARICIIFDKEGLLDKNGNGILPQQLKWNGSRLTGRTWKHQALHYLEQGRSRALLNSIIKRSAVTERQRKFIKEAVMNPMALVAHAAARAIKNGGSLAASPTLPPVDGLQESAVQIDTREMLIEGQSTHSESALTQSTSPKESVPALTVQTLGLETPSLSPHNISPQSGIASPQSEEALIIRTKIFMRWQKALLYALTKIPTLGAALPNSGTFGEIDDMISRIPTDTVVVEYALASTAPSGVMTIVATCEGVQAADWKPADATAIQQCIADLRTSMTSAQTRTRGNPTSLPQPPPQSPRSMRRPSGPIRQRSAIFQAQRDEMLRDEILRDTIVAPIEPYIKGKKEIVIVPSGDLAHVPWTIFFDLPITVVPSLNIWSRLQTQVGASTCKAPRISVVSNAPIDKEREKRNLPAHRDIPFSRLEALYIARQHDQWPFIADDGDREAFQTLANGTQILHLCAHSTFNADDPMSSTIQLFDEPLTMVDWRNFCITADLVVFSSCLSGVSKAFDSGSTIGFAHTLLGTGTKAFLGSLWPVNDEATLLLMIMFYKELRKPLPAADALYHAQQRMKKLTEDDLYEIIGELEDLASNGTVYNFVINPEYDIEVLKGLDVKEMAEARYWAAFVMTGYGSRSIYPELHDVK